MKIAVDAYYLAGRLRGMARFAQMLLQSLPRRAALLCRSGGAECGEIHNQGPEVVSLVGTVHATVPGAGSESGFSALPLQHRAALDTLTAGDRRHPRSDLSDRDLGASPSAVQNLGRHYRKIVVRRIAKKSHRIVTCSEYSKGQIVALFGIDPAKIVVIPNVVGEEWFAECPKPDLATPYVLAVAGEAPSKNTRRLIEAMALLHARMPQLTLRIAGVSSRFQAAFVDFANRRGLGSRVQLLPYLEDTECA